MNLLTYWHTSLVSNNLNVLLLYANLKISNKKDNNNNDNNKIIIITIIKNYNNYY